MRIDEARQHGQRRQVDDVRARWNGDGRPDGGEAAALHEDDLIRLRGARFGVDQPARPDCGDAGGILSGEWKREGGNDGERTADRGEHRELREKVREKHAAPRQGERGAGMCVRCAALFFRCVFGVAPSALISCLCRSSSEPRPRRCHPASQRGARHATS